MLRVLLFLILICRESKSQYEGQERTTTDENSNELQLRSSEIEAYRYLRMAYKWIKKQINKGIQMIEYGYESLKDGLNYLYTKVTNTTSTAFYTVSNFTKELFDDIEKLFQVVLETEYYKIVRRFKDNLTELLHSIGDSFLSLSILIICLLWNYAAFVHSVSLSTLLGIDGFIYLIHCHWGPQWMIEQFLVVCGILYTPVVWVVNSYSFYTLTVIMSVISISFCIFSWVNPYVQQSIRRRCFRGYFRNTDDRVYTIDVEVAHIKAQLNQIKEMLTKISDKPKPVDGKLKKD